MTLKSIPLNLYFVALQMKHEEGKMIITIAIGYYILRLRVNPIKEGLP
jgi:hypothetical protein